MTAFLLPDLQERQDTWQKAPALGSGKYGSQICPYRLTNHATMDLFLKLSETQPQFFHLWNGSRNNSLKGCRVGIRENSRVGITGDAQRWSICARLDYTVSFKKPASLSDRVQHLKTEYIFDDGYVIYIK